MEPALLVYHLRGGLRILVIARHKADTLGQDFAVICQLHLNTRHYLPYGADHNQHLLGIVDRNHRRGLGHAIALEYVHLGRSVEPDNLVLDGGSAGDNQHLMAAQRLAPLGIDQLVGNRVWQLVQGILALIVELQGLVERPFVNHSRHALQLVTFGLQLVEHHLHHTRHRAEAVRMGLIQIAGDAAKRLRIVYADTEILVFVVHAALIDVAERQKAQHPVTVVADLHVGMSYGVKRQTDMFQHYTFGHSGGAGGVDYGANLILSDFLFVLLNHRSPFIRLFLPKLEQLLPIFPSLYLIDGKQFRTQRHFLDQRTYYTQYLLVAYKDRPRTAVVQDVPVVLLAQCRINRD